MNYSAQESRVYLELIETLWNVNCVLISTKENIMGINRNIVECKFVFATADTPAGVELIETLWNVNMSCD